MSHISERANRGYRARWLDPDGRERSRTFTRKAQAERHLATVDGPSYQHTPWLSRLPMGRDASLTGRPQQTRVASLISKHVDGTQIGSMRLAAVRPSQVQAQGQRPIPSSLTWHAAASGGDSAVHLRSGRPRSARGVQPRTGPSMPHFGARAKRPVVRGAGAGVGSGNANTE
jgi:hypothetical protein